VLRPGPSHRSRAGQHPTPAGGTDVIYLGLLSIDMPQSHCRQRLLVGLMSDVTIMASCQVPSQTRGTLQAHPVPIPCTYACTKFVQIRDQSSVVAMAWPRKAGCPLSANTPFRAPAHCATESQRWLEKKYVMHMIIFSSLRPISSPSMIRSQI
jgi:hypothetical protein